MSVTKPLDGWDRNAAQLLRLRILQGSPDTTVSYAPDTRLDANAKVQVGPLSVQINRILRQHADLWAAEMRDFPPSTADAGKNAWLETMREADAAIKQLLAGHKLGHGAAA